VTALALKAHHLFVHVFMCKEVKLGPPYLEEVGGVNSGGAKLGRGERHLFEKALQYMNKGRVGGVLSVRALAILKQGPH
jgi:hypothetical protein